MEKSTKNEGGRAQRSIDEFFIFIYTWYQIKRSSVKKWGGKGSVLIGQNSTTIERFWTKAHFKFQVQAQLKTLAWMVVLWECSIDNLKSVTKFHVVQNQTKIQNQWTTTNLIPQRVRRQSSNPLDATTTSSVKFNQSQFLTPSFKFNNPNLNPWLHQLNSSKYQIKQFFKIILNQIQGL